MHHCSYLDEIYRLSYRNIYIVVGTIYGTGHQDFSIKINIQIILTTHRTDTIQIVSLLDDENIGMFSMKNTCILDKTKIIRSHPLLVTFRITKDRELINVKTKVYVESLNDYYFYSSFYRSFSNLCQEMRAFKQKRIW